MPKPVSRKKIRLQKKSSKGVRIKATGKAQLAPPPYNAKLDKRPVQPYTEEGSTLTEAEMERSKNIKTEERGYKGLVRFVQGGAAGTKG